MTSSEIKEHIIKGGIDPNSCEDFFGGCIKAVLLWLNDNILLMKDGVTPRKVPHFILNTGDELMYRELMNYQYDRGGKVTDEDFVYNAIPRCIVETGSISTQPDQLTQPYVRGVFELPYDGQLWEFSAETRRVPVQLSLSLKYYIDSFQDALALSQRFITDILYIRTLKFQYMGETVQVSLKFPESFDTEKPTSLEFGNEGRFKTISIDLQVDTNIPVYNPRTAVPTDKVISVTKNDIILK